MQYWRYPAIPSNLNDQLIDQYHNKIQIIVNQFECEKGHMNIFGVPL
ncbi:hypothetical protein JCM19235_4226 [Vibrio maritimus]|uniref:Uncharacterized protein n=1 Tax=Vibrio maritimus TaxID=990268 RepID=A0A090RXP5_9VIBR|nr:hypothetical protein JCM19235_4226 [Vibrio maritimus]